MQFQDDMKGFLTALKGGAHESNPALPAPTPHAAVGTAMATGPTPVRNPRSLNGFGPPFPSFSGAISSDRLSAGGGGGGGGPVSRTFSVLRCTGEPSLGSFNNGLHPMPPSLSADPPLHTASIPQRSPPSPIPHLHPNAFANNSTYHPFGLSHLNQSPSSVARNTLNYSPQPPPPASVTATASHPHPTPAAPGNGLPPHVQPLPQSTHHPIAQPPISLPQQQPSRQPTPVEQSSDPSAPQSRPQETSQTQIQQPYSQYAAPQPQPMYKVPMIDPNSVVRNSTPLPQASRPLRCPEAPTSVKNVPSATETRTETKRGRSSHTPSKRARTNGRQNSPNTPRSTTGGGGSGLPAWGTPNGGSNKSRSGTTGPSNTDGTGNGHATSATEEQSRPERKREREKRRRETMNTRFNELAQCLVISAGGKSDKESILAEAVEHCKKQAATIRDLQRQNQELMSEARDLRAEKSELRQDKNYLREERDRLKAELDTLRAELDEKKRQKVEYDVKREDMKRRSSKRNGETTSERKAEAVRV